ncbi:hypothetical protein MLD38_020209 [Melastoma candidum]|uniref:Uncharacterized protein n=1 Tax=Melastoma candidum TaxID=119954 RepID=A0ACB9QF89_9MYRT|nr:hypothetical protein MLD38_020209 [Melastoma candidum]
MASEGARIGSALVLVFAILLIAYQGEAQLNGCTRVLMTLTPCLNYVSGNTSSPSSTCCSTLANVVQSQPQCLCLLLNGAASSYGYNINQTLALELPGACNVQTPSVSQCNAAAPSSPPTSSPPADSLDNTPTTPATSSNPTVPSGSKTVPTTASDGTKVKGLSAGSILLATALAAVASGAFTF